MSIIGVIWIVLIVLKILGVALVGTSWAWVLLWPLIPIAIILFFVLVFGVSLAAVRGY